MDEGSTTHGPAIVRGGVDEVVIRVRVADLGAGSVARASGSPLSNAAWGRA